MSVTRRKWRPSLALVLGGGLAGTLVLSLLGLVALRYLGPEMGFRQAAVLLALLIGLATAILGYLLIRLLMRPVQALATYAGAVRSGHPAPPPQQFGTRELGQLGDAVLDMSETLQRREASIRGFADHVTHELKTPVTAIRAAAELLQDSPDLDPADTRLLQEILGATGQMQSQLEALNQVTAARAPDHHGVCCLGDLLPELRDGFPALELVAEGENTPLPLAGSGLGLVLHHLLDNAGHHGATRVVLNASPGRLQITDNGPGVSPGNRSRIFAPFFTTRRETGGTGMGLAIVASLLTAHGHRIALEDTDQGAGQGACFVISFSER